MEAAQADIVRRIFKEYYKQDAAQADKWDPGLWESGGTLTAPGSLGLFLVEPSLGSETRTVASEKPTTAK